MEEKLYITLTFVGEEMPSHLRCRAPCWSASCCSPRPAPPSQPPGPGGASPAGTCNKSMTVDGPQNVSFLFFLYKTKLSGMFFIKLLHHQKSVFNNRYKEPENELEESPFSLY